MTKETLKRVLGFLEVDGKSTNLCLLDDILNKLGEDEFAKLHSVLFDSNFVQIVCNESLKSSIDAFFENNLNVCETSAKTFLHRNTLNYRLDKIEKMTGFDLRNFDDAFTFKILMQMYDKLRK